MTKVRKNIIIAAGLALAWAAPVFAGPPAYGEAAAPWSAAQAAELVPAMDQDFLKSAERALGPAAAAGLALKKEKVSALLERFRTCSLNPSDADTAKKYFIPEFAGEVRYLAGGGCAELKRGAEGAAPAARSASLGGLEALSASGAFATREGSARFFDGAAAGGAAVQLEPGAPGYRPAAPAARTPAAAYSSKQLASKVPALRAETTPQGKAAARPSNFGEDGMVHQAMAHWNAQREQRWEDFKHAEKISEKGKGLLSAATGAAFQGLLMYSNLMAVETGGARLRWDLKHGAGSGVIAADSAKLAFNSAVFILAFAPIPMVKIVKGALAGEAWAIAMAGAMSAGTVNHYLLHVAD